MRTKAFVIICSIIAAFILLCPRIERYKDGGSVAYKALLYEVIDYHQLDTESETGYRDGLEIKVLGMSVYNNM